MRIWDPVSADYTHKRGSANPQEPDVNGDVLLVTSDSACTQLAPNFRLSCTEGQDNTHQCVHEGGDFV